MAVYTPVTISPPGDVEAPGGLDVSPMFERGWGGESRAGAPQCECHRIRLSERGYQNADVVA
jgi:hypothetical protein